MDGAIVEWLNGFVGRWAIVDAIVRAFVSDYLVAVFGGLLIVSIWLLGRDNEQRFHSQVMSIVGMLAVGLTNLSTELVNFFYFRPRPFRAFDLDLSLFYPPTDSSFPANSAGVAFTISAVLFMYNRKLGWLMLAFAVLWGFSRVFAGIHYPTDILGGAAIGIVVAFFSLGFVRLFIVVPLHVLRIARLFYIA